MIVDLSRYLTLHQYRIDRMKIVNPATNIEEQASVLVLTDNDRREHPFLMSAVDAKQISIMLGHAANEAQEAKRREQG